ncbi:unnamed protein product [Lasius platythorax]|uniref:Uncharacterized protein n=1 Tax=Lasius platythorax TaxID=488582 RepID=A0AAV2MY28_9HYME
MDEWKGHFMEMLEGKEEKTDIERGKKEEREEREEEEEKQENGRNNGRIGGAEVKAQVKKLKRGKAAEEDGINNKAWIFMKKEIGEPLIKVMEKVWGKKRARRLLEERDHIPNIQGWVVTS